MVLEIIGIVSSIIFLILFWSLVIVTIIRAAKYTKLIKEHPELKEKKWFG